MKFFTIPAIAVSLLLIPFTAMQFTDQVNWSPFDFILMGFLLLLAGIGIEWIRRRNLNLKKRLIYILIILIAFLLIWVELAVGVFGSPFAGN